jgi:hypothetical protein
VNTAKARHCAGFGVSGGPSRPLDALPCPGWRGPIIGLIRLTITSNARVILG